jgi:hypothetical protein
VSYTAVTVLGAVAKPGLLRRMGSKPTTRVEALLDDLCLTYGYCLPPDHYEALLADPPQDVEALVYAVLVAEGEIPEGHDPRLVNKRTRREVGDVVRDWLFDEGRGKGTKSGLP